MRRKVGSVNELALETKAPQTRGFSFREEIRIA